MSFNLPVVNTIMDAIIHADQSDFDNVGEHGDELLKVACTAMLHPDAVGASYVSTEILRAGGARDCPAWMTPTQYYVTLHMLAGIADHFQRHAEASALPPIDTAPFMPFFEPKHHFDIEAIVQNFCAGIMTLGSPFDSAAHHFRNGMFTDLINYVCKVPETDSALTEEHVTGGKREALRLSPEAALKDIEGRHERSKHPLDADRHDEHVVPQLVYDMLDLAEEYPEDAAFIFRTVARLLDDKAEGQAK